MYISDGSSVLTNIRNLNSKTSECNPSVVFSQSLDKFNYFMMVCLFYLIIPKFYLHVDQVIEIKQLLISKNTF